uniref:Uncharacterized protein n=1 Tax=Arundo donax TaxID=35708 RepID=A0A0A9BBY5_ARUDO
MGALDEVSADRLVKCQAKMGR